MDELVRVSLRMPKDLWEALRALAGREGRSLHAQILYMLRRMVEEQTR